MKHISCFFFVCFFFMKASFIYAESEGHRIRLLSSILELSTTEIFDNSDGVTEKTEPTTVGGTLHYITPFDFGIGYTALSTTFHLSNSQLSIDYKMDYSFVDLFYTFGSEFTTSLGLGIMVDSQGEVTVTPPSSASEETYISKVNNAGSVFVLFGYNFDLFDFVLGYRRNELKFEELETSEGSQLSSSLSGTSQQIFIGLGI